MTTLIQRLQKIRSRKESDKVAGRALAKMIVGILLHGILFFIIGMIVIPRRIIFSLGLIVGLAGAIFAAISIYDALDIGLDLGEKSARMHVIKKTLIRFAVAIILMVGAILINIYAFVGVTVGLLSLKTSGLFHMAINKFLGETD